VPEGPDRGECEPPKSDYAFSMPKLRARPTKTVQLKLANLLDFHAFRRVLLVRVSPGIALITRRSARDEKEKTSSSKKFGTKPYHCVPVTPTAAGKGKSPARQQADLY